MTLDEYFWHNCGLPTHRLRKGRVFVCGLCRRVWTRGDKAWSSPNEGVGTLDSVTMRYPDGTTEQFWGGSR